jgi:4-amino-4-deoxy-L-arabinose transferase-like glycosyltransferase
MWSARNIGAASRLVKSREITRCSARTARTNPAFELSYQVSLPRQRLGSHMSLSSLALPVPRLRGARIRLLAAISLVPVIVTVVFWSILPQHFRVNESADFFSYYAPVAKNLLAGRGLVTGTGFPAIEYPPAQPIALATTFATAKVFGVDQSVALRFFILVCVTWSCIALVTIARRMWGNVGAVIFAIAWCTYPLTLWLAKQPNSELLFTSFLTTGVALLVPVAIGDRRGAGWWFGAGLAIGGAMLVRSIAILVPAVVCVVVLWRARTLSRRARIVGCELFLACVTAIVGTWELLVFERAGVVVPLSAGGAAAMKDGFTFGIEKRDYRQGVSVPADVEQLMQPIQAQRMNTSGDVLAAFARQARAHPVAALKLMGIKLARAWYGTDSEHLETYIFLLQCLYVSVLLIATWRAWQLGGKARELAIMLWAIVGCFWAMNLLSLPLARYMTPALGMLFLLIPALWSYPRGAPATTDATRG